MKRGLYLLTSAMCQQELLLCCHVYIPGTAGVTAGLMLGIGLHTSFSQDLTWATSFLAACFSRPATTLGVLCCSPLQKFFVKGNLTFFCSGVHFILLVLLNRDQPSPSSISAWEGTATAPSACTKPLWRLKTWTFWQDACKAECRERWRKVQWPLDGFLWQT